MSSITNKITTANDLPNSILEVLSEYIDPSERATIAVAYRRLHEAPQAMADFRASQRRVPPVQQYRSINLVEDAEVTPKKTLPRQPATPKTTVNSSESMDFSPATKPNLTSLLEAGVKTERVSTLLKPDSTILPKKSPVEILQSKFPGPFVQSAGFNTECSKLQTFLSTEISRLKNSSDADLIYVCMGHGNIGEQVWPGFVLEQLQSGKTVHSVLFECGNPYPFHLANAALNSAYQNYPDANSRLYDYLDECFSVDQFLCGIPRINAKTHEDLSEREKRILDDRTCCWKTKKQIQEVHENFQRYIEILLSQGKQIVLSDHSGSISSPNYLVEVYNTLLQKHPQQLHFLWGWEDANAMTNQPIKSEDTIRKQVKPQGTIWTHYPEESGGLYRCKLPLS